MAAGADGRARSEMAAEMAAAAVRLPEFHSASALPSAVPAPPRWQRPAGNAPRPFLVKGTGQLCCTPRVFQKVTRRSNTSAPAQISAATYRSRESSALPWPHRLRCLASPRVRCAGPAAEPGKWVGGRWKSPWERPELQQPSNAPTPASQRRPATADRLAESSRVSQDEYARFYEVQTGAPPSPRVLAAFVASQALGVGRGDNTRRAAMSATPTTAKQRRNQRVLASIEGTTRYKEPYPRPPRDPSGHEPRSGAALSVFASSLRDYTPAQVRGYSERSAYEAAKQLHRPSFVLMHVGPAGCDLK